MEGVVIKTIIFDYGNVIGNNPSPFIFESIHYEFGVEYNTIKEVVAKLIPKSQIDLISENDFWNEVSRSLGICDSEKLKRVWMEAYIRNAKIDKEMISLIRELKNRGYKICLLSNIANIYRDSSLKKEIEKEIPTTFYSYNLKTRRPEKRIYELLIEKLGVEPKECVFIDDEEENLTVPEEIGMETILFKSSEDLRSELLKILNWM